MFYSILFIGFIGFVASQCPGFAGPCVDDSDCPEVCIVGSCCSLSSTTEALPEDTTTPVETSTATTNRTTTKASSCVDRINPRTGISDCPATAHLCSDATYYDVMTYQCPKTCNRCSSVTSSTGTCADLPNPRTGVSDCPTRAHLCNNSVYFDLMTEQCPKTCGRCTTETNTATSSTTTCADKTNDITGVSDCPSRVDYCTNAAYASFMRTECPRTCGYCTSG